MGYMVTCCARSERGHLHQRVVGTSGSFGTGCKPFFLVCTHDLSCPWALDSGPN